MRIFAYVGSRRHNSNTLKVVKSVIDGIVKTSKELVEYDVFVAEDLKLEFCIGCAMCFNKGFCVLDEKDGFDEIKKKMLLADVIIIGSPVLAGTVSGDTKVFIDRLAYWLHLFPFYGKLGITVVTASCNSAKETNMYLSKIVESWGSHLACSIACTVDMPNMIDSPIFNNETIPKYAESIINLIERKRRSELVPSQYQEKYFLALKQTYDVDIELDNAELKYWRSRGYIKFNSYKELIDNIC